MNFELAAVERRRLRIVRRKRRPAMKVELDDGVAREARRHRLEISDFAGQIAAGHSVPPRWPDGVCGQLSI